MGDFSASSRIGLDESGSVAEQWILIDKDVALKVDCVNKVLIDSYSKQRKLDLLRVLDILGRASFNHKLFLELDVPYFDELIRRTSHKMLLIDPIDSENTTIMSIFFLSNALVL